MPHPVNLELPGQPGTYILLMHLASSQQLAIGQAGTFDFAPGFYLYVGSAHGSGGLRGRLGRHLRRDKKLHWHIDYLSITASIQEVWFSIASKRQECNWAEVIRNTNGCSEPASGFGASDCICNTHLFTVSEDRIISVWQALGQPPRIQIS